MRKKRQPWILGFLLLTFTWTSSCGEPIPVDCATEEECTTENEGGFQTGTVAGIAAGGAAVAVLAGGAISGGSESSGGSSGGTNGSSETVPSKESMDTSPDTVSTVLPTYSTDPSQGDVITGTSVLKIAFNKSVTGVSTTNVVLKDASGITVTMDYTAPALGNIYTFDPNPDLTSGSYYLSIGEGPIVDSDGQSVTASIIEFRVEDALTTGRAAMEAAGLSSTIIIAANNAAAAVTNNLLSVIPAAMSAGIVAASTSAEKSTVISSLLGTVNGAASLTSTADRTITRITDTANFDLLLNKISETLTALTVAGWLSSAELQTAVVAVNSALTSAGADTDQIAAMEATFNNAITADIAAESSLAAEYTTAITTATSSSSSTGTVAGMSYVLTTSIDIITGTAGNDTINALDTTLTTFDTIDGKGGTDTLVIAILGGSGTLSGFSSSDIEVISVAAYSDHTVDLGATSGVTTVKLSGTNNVTFTNVPNLVESENNGSGNLIIEYIDLLGTTNVYLIDDNKAFLPPTFH